MKREFHARFWERPGAKFPRATRQWRRFASAPVWSAFYDSGLERPTMTRAVPSRQRVRFDRQGPCQFPSGVGGVADDTGRSFGLVGTTRPGDADRAHDEARRSKDRHRTTIAARVDPPRGVADRARALSAGPAAGPRRQSPPSAAGSVREGHEKNIFLAFGTPRGYILSKGSWTSWIGWRTPSNGQGCGVSAGWRGGSEAFFQLALNKRVSSDS